MFSLQSGKTQGDLLSQCLLSIYGRFKPANKARKIRKIQIRRVGVKLTFADMTVHNSMASVKSEFSKVVE